MTHIRLVTGRETVALVSAHMAATEIIADCEVIRRAATREELRDASNRIRKALRRLDEAYWEMARRVEG